MLCGNDPAARGRLTTLDAETVEWFRAWLAWSKRPAAERATIPAPRPPAGAEGIVADGPDQ